MCIRDRLNTVYVLNKKDGKLKGISTLIKTFRKNNYDLVINLHRFGSSGIIAGFSGGKKVIGFKKNPFSFLYSEKFDHQIGDGTHEVERNLSLIVKLGSEKSVRPELYPSETDKEKVQSYAQGNYVTMAPASCLLYTSPSPRDATLSRMPSSA